MSDQATAAPARGHRTTDPLVLAEEEHDTLAWILTEGHALAQGATEDADDDMRRSMLSMHEAWVGPIFHTPRFAHDGTVIVDLPAQEPRRALARLLRLLSASARPNTHSTGMVFYVTARDAAALADRIEATGQAAR